MMPQLSVRPIDQADLAVVESLSRRSTIPLVYDSVAYRRFLQAELPGADLYCLGCYDDDRLAGALVSFLSPPTPSGRVLNSLPFFGSHGGPLVDPEDAHADAIQRALVHAYFEQAECVGAVAATLVENPGQPLPDDIRTDAASFTLSFRTSQITPLPSAGTVAEAETKIMDICHQKTRNAVRKGLAHISHTETDHSDGALRWLQAVHETSINALGGVAKTMGTLTNLRDAFAPSDGFHLSIANRGATRLAALLLLTYDRSVEYFTPAVDEAYRDTQVLSALIFKQMATFASLGYRDWNWGGTWQSQTGVHRFKSRFGAVDRNYVYLTRVYDRSIRELPPSQVLALFRHFYVYPFDEPRR